MTRYSAARPPVPFNLQLAQGRIEGMDAVRKFGRNPDVDSGSWYDVWDGGAHWVPPTAAQYHTLSSTSASDAAGGAGATAVNVYGLDGDYLPMNETVAMNGSGSTVTASQYTRIFRMIAASSGSLMVNAGVITATASNDGTVTANIAASVGQTLMAIYTTAASVEGYVTKLYAFMNRNVTTGAADVRLTFEDVVEQTMNVKFFGGLVAAGNSVLEHEYSIPLKVPPKTDVRLQADVSADNTDISGGFDMYIVSAS